MNSIIQSLKRASRGFRNVGYFTTMIFLRLGRLGLLGAAGVRMYYPLKTRKSPFNAARTIERCLDSLLAQQADVEIIVRGL